MLEKENDILTVMRYMSQEQENEALDTTLGAGVNKKGFVALIKDLKYRFKIRILVLLETKISGMKVDAKIKQLGFSNSFRQEAVGYSGGIWILWDDAEVSIQVIQSDHQFVHARVLHKSLSVEELVTFMYASPRHIERLHMWEELCVLASSINNEAWMVLGDFNAMILNTEKKRGGDFCWRSDSEFKDCLDYCLVKDIGFSGPYSTWKRNSLYERLDRVCVNDQWNLAWPERDVTHLPFFSLDHCPILLTHKSYSDDSNGAKPFRFLAPWLTTEGFNDIVSRCWDSTEHWLEARDRFQEEVLAWHNNYFRSTQKQKNRLHAHIRGIEISLMSRYDHNLDMLLRSLWKELESILIREELNWFQRSRCDWIKLGDRNTKFYHSNTVAKRRRNEILTLKNENGEWLADPK
ncbi:uncharacterized protein LOC133316380 [Gastrolobium bilobum]|uniref:uncharacterized protein LOC133316380 n=1 Tax=Gastrolobium bilobum TaxID=150636 RepID=UPI002AB1A458|nr:uncharacterized protein LOC133316380 [Gastrolobium bilobum]